MGPKLHDYWPFVPDWLPVHSYGLCIALGFILAALIARRRAGKLGLNQDAFLDLAFWVLFAGIIGSRVFYVVQFWGSQFQGQPLWQIFAIHKGGLVFYGGVLGGIPVFFWFLRRKKLPLLSTLDVAASVIMLALACGRIGCFSYGCCWGKPTDASWGVVFPPNAPAYYRTQFDPVTSNRLCRFGGSPLYGPRVPASPARDGELGLAGASYASGRLLPPGTRLIPTQLINSFNAFCLFVILSLYFNYFRKRPGEVLGLALILYPANRFCMEFLRHDTSVPNGLSVSQWVSAGLFLCGVAISVWVRTRPSPEAVAAAPSPPQDSESQAGRKR